MDLITKAIPLAAKGEMKDYLFNALDLAANVEVSRGNLNAAGDYMDRAQALQDELKDKSLLIYGYMDRGEVYYDRGGKCDYDRNFDLRDRAYQLSHDDYEQALAIAREFGNDILALKGTDIVRVSSPGGEPRKLYAISGIIKLVGFSMDDPDSVLILSEDAAGHSGLGLLSVNTGKITALAYDPASSDDRHMIEHLRGWDRIYGNTTVYVKHRTKQGLGGPAEWTEVYLKVGADEPVDISHCDEVNSGQPSLSADGRLVVFIKAGQD
jgi:hypothetical protein